MPIGGGKKRALASRLKRGAARLCLPCLVALALLAACRALDLEPPTSSNDHGRVVEPASAVVFMDEYARGDLASSDQAASPLYRAEWARRGTSLQDRYAILPEYFKAPTHPTEWLHFTYVGGLVDDVGFKHLLFTAHATVGGPADSPTVWRVDTDADGRVIWAEMVYLFSSNVSAVTLVDGIQGPPATPVPRALSAYRERPMMGIQSAHSREGYWEIGPRPVSGNSQAGASSPIVFFIGIDEDGNFRPGAWSYGKPTGGRASAGSAAVPLSADDARLLQTYLDTLP